MEERRVSVYSDKGIPLGVRIAMLFLRIMVISMGLVLLFALFYLIVSLAAVWNAGSNFKWALLWSLSALGGFLLVFVMVGATEWMWQFLRARHVPPELLSSGPPRHPVILFGRPPLQIVWLYSVLSLIGWAVMKFGELVKTTWAWPVFWVALGVVASVGIRVLRRYFPENSGG